jgi:alanine racemase
VQAAPDARVWAVVKANAYGHGIERAYPGLRGADGFALLDLAEAERVRALGWRGPILLLEGLLRSAGPGAVLAPGPVACRALHAADRLAGSAQDAPAAPRVPQDEQRHEPPGLRPETFRAAWAG